jgi:hypothetical protein
VITIDPSKLTVAAAVQQLEQLSIDVGAHLVALVESTPSCAGPQLAAGEHDIAAASACHRMPLEDRMYARQSGRIDGNRIRREPDGDRCQLRFCALEFNVARACGRFLGLRLQLDQHGGCGLVGDISMELALRASVAAMGATVTGADSSVAQNAAPERRRARGRDAHRSASRCAGAFVV